MTNRYAKDLVRWPDGQPDAWTSPKGPPRNKAKKRASHNDPTIRPHCHPNQPPACKSCGCENIFITTDEMIVTLDANPMKVFFYNCSYCGKRDITCIGCAVVNEGLTLHKGEFPIIFEGYEIQLESLIHEHP